MQAYAESLPPEESSREAIAKWFLAITKLPKKNCSTALHLLGIETDPSLNHKDLQRFLLCVPGIPFCTDEAFLKDINPFNINNMPKKEKAAAQTNASKEAGLVMVKEEIPISIQGFAAHSNK